MSARTTTIAFTRTGDADEEGKPPEQSGESGEKQEAPILRPDNEAKDLPLNTTLGNQTSREPQNTKEKLGHRRIDEQGGVSYKKVPTNALMQAIQLGISNSIGSLASLPNRDVLLQDFEKVDIIAFPAAGSSITPSHSFGDFRFRTYAPIAFRYFRNLFHIKPADFLRSICTEPLKELSNAGASGSIFYVSQDDQFIIKTVQHKEADFLQKLLPGYYMNLNQNPRTLLPKFFGLFCYQFATLIFQSLGKNIRLLVMNNLLPQTVTLHEKYDLKGSTYKRMANKAERAKPHPTLKDLDFLENHKDGIFIDPIALDALMRSISRDCLVMESFKIMDYSLLVGIHNVELGIRERAELNGEAMPAPSTSNEQTGEKGENHKVLQEKFSVWDTGDGDVPHGGVPARNSNGDRLVLYLGIIDILQNYRLLKKMEHTWKAILHDGDTISVHNPNFYASRFLSFMTEKVFKKGTALKQSPSRRRMMKGSSHEDDTTVIVGTGHRQHRESEREGLNMTVTVPDGGASTSTPREQAQFGSQTARESTRLYNRDVSAMAEDRANSARDPVSSMSRVPLRRSYRDAGQAMSVEKKEKKVERLFAQPKPTDEKVPEEQEETEEIVSGDTATA
ncbi:CRE-PPK-1 protein [Caenorhabditis remanei]|uniref:CRE-PPK-1 protein n=1 Tax=Caenorhabditis remanei TaxID=31234 RepID=E3LVG9_CAERE|nr:CRE-PPK-1 protein [Caenorhabditis remanei]